MPLPCLWPKPLVRQGCHVLFVQSYESRIHGGHLSNLIRLSDRPLISSGKAWTCWWP